MKNQNYLFTFLLLFAMFLMMSFSCSELTNQAEVQGMNASENDSITSKDPYQLRVSMDKISDDKYYIDVHIDIDSGSYIVSPFDLGSSGRFRISLPNNEFLNLDHAIIENPPHVLESFQWSDRKSKVIRDKINFRKQIELVSEDDFKISGVIYFVIEPKCTMEKINFILWSEAGELKIERKGKEAFR